MKRHDTVDLWNYAARGLHAEDARFTEEHLLDCPDCQATLARVRQAQAVLGDARLAQPKLSLTRADAALAKEISRRLLKKAKPVRWGLVAAPLAIAVALLVGLALRAWPLPELAPAVSPVADEVVPLTPAGIQVERAADTVRASDGEGLQNGGQLASGEVVSTGGRGLAMLKLPDTSRLRLAASSRLRLSAVSARSVELHLERGRVVVHAAHVPRDAFTVHTADVTVHVLGTTFAVTRAADFVEVAVSEGRVGVESPRGLPFFVSAGERVRVGTRSWRPVSRAITGALKDELREVAPLPASAGAPSAAVGGAALPATRPGVAPASASNAGVAAAPAPSLEAPLTVPLVVTPLDPERVGAPVKPAGAGGGEVPDDWKPMPNSRAPVGLRGVAEPNPPGQEVSVVAAAGGVGEAPGALPAAAAVSSTRKATGVDPAPTAPAPPPSAKPIPAAQPSVASAPAAPAAPAPAASAPAASAPAAPAPAASAPAASAPVASAPVASAPVPSAPPASPPATSVPSAASASGPSALVAAAPASGTTTASETRGPMPEDLEELFLMRAERALRNGGCDRYLLGLADIAEDPQKTVRQERARIAMARCQQALGQPEAAAQEFARYIRDFPKGLFAREATAAAATQPAVAK